MFPLNERIIVFLTHFEGLVGFKYFLILDVNFLSTLNNISLSDIVKIILEVDFAPGSK